MLYILHLRNKRACVLSIHRRLTSSEPRGKRHATARLVCDILPYSFSPDQTPTEIMAGFVQELWESIFTPGPTPALLIATNATFAALQFVLGGLLIATYSIHFAILSVLCGGLWAAINWFARELRVHQLQEEEKERRAQAAGPPAYTSDEEETEVEETAASTTSLGRGKPPSKAAAVSKEVEPVEAHGELKHRLVVEEAASQGTKSSVSTEDEWERVSESENDKDK